MSCDDECSAGSYVDAETGATSCTSCPPGTIGSDPGATFCTTCANPSRCPGGGTCKKGHDGDFCSFCDEGFYWLGSSCESCPNYGPWMWLIAAAVAVSSDA